MHRLAPSTWENQVDGENEVCQEAWDMGSGDDDHPLGQVRGMRLLEDLPLSGGRGLTLSSDSFRSVMLTALRVSAGTGVDAAMRTDRPGVGTVTMRVGND